MYPEFLDHATINYVEDYENRPALRRRRHAAGGSDGHPAQVEDDAAVVEKVLKECGSTEVVVAKDAEQKKNIWEARRVAIPALCRAKPTFMMEDVTVPRSKIPAMIAGLEKIAKDRNVTIATFGHAGDGNLHPGILCDKRDKQEWARVELAVDDLFNLGLELKGTLSGEHGIGLAKKQWLEQETSRGSIMFFAACATPLIPRACSIRKNRRGPWVEYAAAFGRPEP